MSAKTVFDWLKEDHVRHRAMLDEIDATQGDSDDRQALFKRFRIEVSAHASAEEQSLYGAMLEEPKLTEEGRHSVAEHKEIDDFIEELEATEMSSSGWLATFRKLKHRYEHHIDEEEREIFKAAEKVFSKAKTVELGKIFADRKPEEKAAERASA